MVRLLRARPVAYFARFTVLVVAGYLSHVAAYVLTPDDRLILAVPGDDARWLFTVATVVAVAYAFDPTLEYLRWAWLVLLTVSAWGRALSLLLIGSPELNRSREVAGFLAWFLVFAAGVLATVVLALEELLRHDRR